ASGRRGARSGRTQGEPQLASREIVLARTGAAAGEPAADHGGGQRRTGLQVRSPSTVRYRVVPVSPEKTKISAVRAESCVALNPSRASGAVMDRSVRQWRPPSRVTQLMPRCIVKMPSPAAVMVRPLA